MPVDELGVGVADQVTAEMVDCTVPVCVPAQPVLSGPDVSPVDQARDATIEQTGSGPPPAGA